jgi:hypothetical protein
MVYLCYDTSQVKQTLRMEWDRAHRIQRTFTEFGFNKGKLPNDLWASISSYYYNNRSKLATIIILILLFSS